MKIKYICLLSILIVLTSGIALAIPDNKISEKEEKTSCHEINAKGIGQDLGNGKTQANILGGGLLHGTTVGNFVITGLAGTVASFEGTVKFTTNHGTLTVTVTGTLDTATGEFSASGPVTGATGKLAGAIGTLNLKGVEDLSNGSFIEDVTGRICVEAVRHKVIPSTVVEFNAAASEAPENLAVDHHGNIYVSLGLTGEIKKVTPGGHVSTFATLPSPGTGFMTGITFDKSGNLFVAFSSFDSNHGIWRVSKDGRETELFAPLTVNGQPDGLPNDLKFDKKGNLYVSDTIGGKVWKIDRKGIISIWKTDPLLMGVVVPGLGPISNFPLGANGLAFDEDEENLYVANMGLGRIVRIPVEDDGNAGDAVVFVEDEPLLRGADGINFDEDGKLYVAVMLQDRIAVISQKGDTAILAEGYPLQNPADVLFGVHGKEDNLYIANFAVLRFLGVVPETPRPALLKMLVDE